MEDMIFATALLLPLAYGAVTDYRRRVIPDGVCAAVALVGLLGAVLLPPGSAFFVLLWQRAAGFFPAAFMLALAYFKDGIGGGDIKLMAALGFAIGIYAMVPVLLVATLTALLWALRQKEKSVPLAVFLFVGVVIYVVV